MQHLSQLIDIHSNVGGGGSGGETSGRRRHPAGGPRETRITITRRGNQDGGGASNNPLGLETILQNFLTELTQGGTGWNVTANTGGGIPIANTGIPM